MRARLRFWLLLGLGLAGCIRPPTAVLMPGRSVAVLPPNNRTGDPLLIAGASFLEKYVLPTERYTVPDALAAEARAQLVQRGFDVVAAATDGQAPSDPADAARLAARNRSEGAALYIEIRRWEPNVGTEPTYVIASVALTLVEASTGRVLWSVDHPSRPVQTPGVINLGDAYSVAAHALMTEMLAPLTPPPASR